MSITIYHASIPVFIHNLGNLAAMLRKAEAHAKARKFDAANLVNARLYPDMFPLSRQIQIATDMAKGCAARLAGIEVPSYPDTETTLRELQDRVKQTVKFLRTVKASQLDGAESRDIKLQMRIGKINFLGQDYLQSWVLPNFYFHIVTAYNILRHNGIELGKADFLGKAPGARFPAARRRRVKGRR